MEIMSGGNRRASIASNASIEPVGGKHPYIVELLPRLNRQILARVIDDDQLTVLSLKVLIQDTVDSPGKSRATDRWNYRRYKHMGIIVMFDCLIVIRTDWDQTDKCVKRNRPASANSVRR